MEKELHDSDDYFFNQFCTEKKMNSTISWGNIQILVNLKLVLLEVKYAAFSKNSQVSYSFIHCSFGVGRGNQTWNKNVLSTILIIYRYEPVTLIWIFFGVLWYCQ